MFASAVFVDFTLREGFLHIIFCWSSLVFLPGNIFLRFFIEMHSNFMHLIESKAKLDYKWSPIFLRVGPCQNLSNLTSVFVYIIQY